MEKGLSWFRGSWMGGEDQNVSGGLRNFEEERRRKAYDTVNLGGLSPEQIVEANRLQLVKDAPAAPAEGGAFDPNAFAAPEGMDGLESFMGKFKDENSILNKMPDTGIKKTPLQNDLLASYRDMRERLNQSQAAPYIRATQPKGGAAKDTTMADLATTHRALELQLKGATDAEQKARLQEALNVVSNKMLEAQGLTLPVEEKKAGWGAVMGNFFRQNMGGAPLAGFVSRAVTGGREGAPFGSEHQGQPVTKPGYGNSDGAWFTPQYHQAAYEWAQANPNDPRAAAIKRRLGIK